VTPIGAVCRSERISTTRGETGVPGPLVLSLGEVALGRWKHGSVVVRILGISCDYHDAAAALVVSGEVVAAVEEERLSRDKHDSSLPSGAISSCLAIGGLSPDDLDAVVVHEKPLAVVSRVLAARQRRGPAALGSFIREFPVLIRRNLLVGYRIERCLRALGATRVPKVFYGEHHLSHAAAAFYPSPFRSAAVLTVDGIGEWSTASIGHGAQHRLDLLAEQRYPHSLGLLYSLATLWCGFEPNDGEYKLMGLAPFGEARFTEALSRVAEVHDDGSITVNARLVKWWGGDPSRIGDLADLFEGPPTPKGSATTARDADLARSVQELAETAIIRMAHHAAELTGESNLCMGGGVALNCVANGRLLREGPFDEIWVQPSPGDAGSAIGAALWYWHEETGHPRARRRSADQSAPATSDPSADGMHGAYLGPSFDDDEVGAWIETSGLQHRYVPSRDELCEEVAGRIAEGSVVGWFQGRMEFGPRALGNRSILADPRSSTVQKDLNLRVKGRESFRPFAPAVRWEDAADWFEISAPSPYMLFTHRVAGHRLIEVADEPKDPFDRVQVVRSEIPACTHVDGSARVQTVHEATNPLFHALLGSFGERTGCPVLLSTSFNRAGEPIVCTPDDAYATAVEAGLDLLVVGPYLVETNGGAP
jgi:carbamoyltransferase